VIVVGLKSAEELCHPPTGLEPLPHTSVALTAHYLNVRQHRLGTIIIQTVHILQHESADTGSLPMEDFFKHNPNYFQITLPGSSTITPTNKWRRQGREFFLDCYCCSPHSGWRFCRLTRPASSALTILTATSPASAV
jgi:hypothetical protein